ncbi:hypothetical protein CEXT_394171 [Caerostris extrusa]|uniref:Uncharacterized protein n=1 Tax=Caerostris extrusa TaxID=172846 RepID=A0AAV4QFJ8_CAEEX|nr:hypothetical protein CEXT_394171 [Caerostris extrusa]
MEIEFSESEQLRSSETGSFSLETSPELKCADPVPGKKFILATTQNRAQIRRPTSSKIQTSYGYRFCMHFFKKAPHLFERKELMADNPEKPGSIQTCRWREETILPALLLQEEKKRTSEAKQSKNRTGERNIKRRMGGRDRKNIHKNTVVYEEEETFRGLGAK